MHGSYYGGGTPRTARQAPYSNGYIGTGSPRQQNIPAANGGPGILFRSRQERVDWRRLASIDVDRIRREYDTSVLQEFVNNVTYCDIEQETDLRTIDPNFIKLFKLAQLIIEYLIHSQSYLSNSVEVVQEQLNQANESHNATKQEFTKLNDELHKAKQESRKRRKQITAQQSIMGLGPNGYHKCPYCDKAFIHATYLQSHLQRKHAEFMTQTEDVEARKENERLEKEIEQMRDKLNLMESQFDDERKTFRQQIEVQKMEQSKMAQSARQEEDEKQQMERWKEQQLDMQRTEMEKMQGMFMKELKEMNEKYSSSQRALEDLQSKYGKQSMLGKMQDEDELAEYKAALKKQQKEQEKLKKQLAKEVTSIKSTMEDELQASERRWKERSRQQKEAHKEEVEQLRDRLEQSKASLRIEREGGDQVGQKYEQQMKDLRKKNKETERSLKEREKQIKDLRAELKSKPKTPVPIPASPSPKPMSPSPEETETETEEEEESDISVFEPMDTQQRKRLVDGMRESLQHILTESLARKGVPEGAKGISSQSLENKLKALKQERQNLARRHPKFYDIRDKWKGELANRTKKRGKQTSGSSRPRPSSSASPQRSSSSQSQHRPSTSKQSSSQPRYSSTPTRPKSTSSTKSSAPLRTSLKTPPPVAPREPIYDIPPNNKLARPSSKARVSFDEHLGEDSDEDDDDESDDDLSDDSDDEEGEIRTKSQTSQGQHRSQGQQRSQQGQQRPQQGQQRSKQGQQRSQQGQRPQTTSKSRSSTEGTIDEESEDDSEWDSEDISELQEVSPSKVTGVSKVTAGQKPTPKGPKVAELSRSIELQLSGRHKDKKPAGGVDLGSTNDSNQLRPASREDERSPSPSIPTIPDADDWDDDDSDSLAVSSLDGSLSAAKPVPTPRQNKPPPGGSRKPTGDTDISNTLGTSLWGSSSNKGSGSGGTGKTSDSVKSSLASVTDFDDDDFDISDEL